MRTAFAVSLAIAVIVSGACSDRTSGPLGSRLASDTTKDSTGSLTIAPAVDTIAMGDSARFTATTADSQPVSWTVSDSTVARIEAGGTGSSVLLRAVATGATAITATSGGRSGSARLVVTDGVPVASVTVTPSLDTLVAGGDTVRFDATPRDADGNRLGDRSVAWTVGDTSLARIESRTSQTVWVRGLKSGSTTLTATSEGQTGSAQVVVTAPPSVASVSVTPSTDTLTVGDDSAFFFATLRDTQGHELSNRAVTWSVSDSSVIKIQYTSGQTVVIRAVTAGSSLLTATSEGKSGAAQVVVTARVPVASVTVTPPADTLGAGDAATFLASPRDAQGNALTNRAVTWVVGDSSVARVEQVLGQSAQVRALKQGTTIITATSEGHSGSAQVVVTAPPPVASVSVTPPVDTLVAGNDSASFNATLRDAAGNPLNGRVVTWTVSDSSVIAIQYANGQWAVIRALKPGSATLTATSEGTSGSASVIVQ